MAEEKSLNELNAEELYNMLTEKVNKEYKEFCDNIMTLPKDKIVKAAYEINTKSDFVFDINDEDTMLHSEIYESDLRDILSYKGSILDYLYEQQLTDEKLIELERKTFYNSMSDLAAEGHKERHVADPSKWRIVFHKAQSKDGGKSK